MQIAQGQSPDGVNSVRFLHRSRTPGVLNDVQVAQEPQMVSIVRKLHKKTTPGVVTNVKVVQEQSPTCCE